MTGGDEEMGMGLAIPSLSVGRTPRALAQVSRSKKARWASSGETRARLAIESRAGRKGAGVLS
jgi:hypothetical protein